MKIRYVTSVLVFIAGLAVESAAIEHSNDSVAAIEACVSLTDRDARLACFDQFADDLLRSDPGADAQMPQQAADAEAEVQSATAFADACDCKSGHSTMLDGPPPRDVEYHVSVTSCKQGHYGNWFFFLDNGQVWKETNKRNRRFKDCNFDATLSKGAFGFELHIEGEKKPVRVRRQQ